MRTIYPMLHSSYKLNWEFAEAQKATAGIMSGSVSTFTLSNVYWLLGVLEALNRNSAVDQLEYVASTTLPAVQEKLSSSLGDAKNAEGGLPTEIVDMAAEYLKSKRSLAGRLGIIAEKLNKRIEELGSMKAGSEEDSFRVKIESMTDDYLHNSEEVATYLSGARNNSEQRWKKMKKAMKRAQQAIQAVDPRNKGNLLGFGLKQMIFGHNSRQAPVDFRPLVDNLVEQLNNMCEQVIDIVIEHVDELIGTPNAVSSLKESFLELDVIKALQQRFSLAFFIKAKQRDPLLHDGNLHSFLRKKAAEFCSAAVHDKILSRSGDMQTVEAIKSLIETNLDEVRIAWQKKTAEKLQDFFGDQFVHLMNDLQGGSRKTAPYSLKAMLAAYLQHIVNTSKLQQDEESQKELYRFIKDLKYKTNSLHSLWVRLARQNDPEELGTEAARHVERRRQRELSRRDAKITWKLGKPNRPMPVTQLPGAYVEKEQLYDAKVHLFIFTVEESIAEMRKALRQTFQLDVYRQPGSFPDLFSAVALVAYKSGALQRANTPDGAPHENIRAAAQQLRALTASQIAHYYCNDEQSRKIECLLGEPIDQYVARVKNENYRGDTLCLFFLSAYFERAFRLWLPGVGSILFRPRNADRANMHLACAFQLMLSANKPEKLAADYSPVWFPVQMSPRRVRFNESINEIRELPMTDDDRAARITSDEEPLAAMKRGQKRPRNER